MYVRCTTQTFMLVIDMISCFNEVATILVDSTSTIQQHHGDASASAATCFETNPPVNENGGGEQATRCVMLMRSRGSSYVVVDQQSVVTRLI